MPDLIWLHEEALGRKHPIFDAASPGSTPVFVWDSQHFQQSFAGPKRQSWIYQRLGQLNLNVYQGKTIETLLALIDEKKAERLLVPSFNNHLLGQIVDKMGARCPVLIVEDRPFVRLESEPDLKRFFRFWNKAKKSAMKPDGGL